MYVCRNACMYIGIQSVNRTSWEKAAPPSTPPPPPPTSCISIVAVTLIAFSVQYYNTIAPSAHKKIWRRARRGLHKTPPVIKSRTTPAYAAEVNRGRHDV